MPLDRREALQLAAGLPLAAAAPAREGQGGGARPNILVIVLDDVGFADLGPYGSEIPTPAIDALAARGTCFTNFHVAPLCSPTRASLLTGMNPHRAGVGTIADWATAAPGYRGTVDRRLPMLPALLSPLGYGCYASGKWHLTALREQGPAGPYGDWPTRRGFDRWYGFQGFNADQFHPELFENTAPTERAPGDDYHLSADLADRMIAMLAEHRSAAPDRPFFGYLAFGACHWPLQVPAADIAAMRGRFDGGWGAARDARYRRQRASGLLSPGTTLPPPNPDVPAWEALSAGERSFAVRGQEVYAGFLHATDRAIGRVLAALDTMGVRDDTLVLLLSDNGATAEGGKLGMADSRQAFNIAPETDAVRAAALAALGDDSTFPAYPLGWAEAGNTPLRWYKSNTHEGGVRTPLIASWPNGGIASGRWRSQYHHVSDVVPTVMELTGQPHAGYDGTSLLYALRRPDAPTAKRVQVFECVGSRALWLDGWKAVARHVTGTDLADDRWELYHAAEDFSEANDLAAAEPARLRALQARWQLEAARGQILPQSDRRMGAEAANMPPQRTAYTFFPRTRIDRLAVPDPARGQRITAELVAPRGAAGVLVAVGGRMRGYELFVADGAATFVWRADRLTTLALSAPLPAGRATLTVALAADGPAREVRLLVDGREGARRLLPASFPLAALAAGLRCGWNPGAPVSSAYRGSNPFTGTLARVRYAMDGA